MAIVLLSLSLILLCLNLGFDVYRFLVKPYQENLDVDSDRLFDAMLLLDIDAAFELLDESELETVDVSELHRSTQALLMYVAERERFVPATYPEAVATEVVYRLLLDLLISGDVRAAKVV
jgi:hypothetical protein